MATRGAVVSVAAREWCGRRLTKVRPVFRRFLDRVPPGSPARCDLSVRYLLYACCDAGGCLLFDAQASALAFSMRVCFHDEMARNNNGHGEHPGKFYLSMEIVKHHRVGNTKQQPFYGCGDKYAPPAAAKARSKWCQKNPIR